MKSDPQKWYETQRRSRLKYMEKLASRPKTKVSQRSKNELPVALFSAARWFARWIVKRDGRCVTFSEECNGPLEASHVYPVSVCSVFRFDERFVYAQCRFHNQSHSSDTSLLSQYLDRKFGVGFYRQMKVKSTAIKVWSIPELRAIITKYKSRLDN